MDIVPLGRTGLKVSRICLGTMTYGSPDWRDWVLEEKASRPFFKRALEAGINFFDTADMYSVGVSEEIVGRALKDFAGSREAIVVATKVYGAMGPSPNQAGLSRKHILHAIDNSLRRLQMDYVDLYQIHRFDPATPIEETVAAMQDVVKAGKARYIGASSMWAWQFGEYLRLMQAAGGPRFVSMQNFYNLTYREEERDVLPLCAAHGIGVIPWSPLSRGFLARKAEPVDVKPTVRAKSDNPHNLTYGPADFAIRDKVAEIAARHGVSNAQVALAWLLHKPAVTAPIVGASKMAHLEDAIQAAELKLSAEEIAALEAPYQAKAVKGHS
jgi:aryl-alcohol dehydrogenase (NADP+)